MTTRRTFLKTSSLAAVAAVNLPSPHSIAGRAPGRSCPLRPPLLDLPHATDPQLQELAARALDAAKSAGATYADVRFTVTRRRTFTNLAPAVDSDTIAVGVRALARGAWGFAATTEWTPDGVARLGQMAAHQARVNAWPRVPPVELGDRPPPPASSATWHTPVTRDPFTVPPAEVSDVLKTAFGAAQQLQAPMEIILTFERQDRTFASTDGAYVTQTIYTSLGGSPHRDTPPSMVFVSAKAPSGKAGVYQLPVISPTGAGYEVVEALRIAEHLPEWVEKARSLADAKPFQTLGEYDVVFDAYAMAPLIDGTFGVALEYDRVVGYEANAAGTSYLAPPGKILGTAWAPAAVTLTADRTLPTGAATVQWDDDGITPQPTPLVKDGVVVNYATTREFASELAAWYHKRGEPVRSNGCAAAESALTEPLVHTPNLTLHPGRDATTFDALLAGIESGFAVFGGDVEMDIQQLTGRGRGAQVYSVMHGKLDAPVTKAAYIFKGQDLWRNLVALGGPQTAALRGLTSSKGQPDQLTVHTINAVAARFQRVRLQSADQA